MDPKEFRAIADSFNEEFMRTVGAVARSQGILARIRHPTVSHMPGGRAANDPGAEQPTNGLISVTATMQLPFEALETGDTARLVEALVGAGAEMRSEMARQLFARMDQIAEQNGMVVDARGKAFSVDLFLEALEKMDIDFDSSGNAIMPECVVHPTKLEKIRAALDTDDAKERIAAVIAKKKVAKGL